VTSETADSEDDYPDVTWLLVTELFNRPTWPTAMWDGSPGMRHADFPSSVTWPSHSPGRSGATTLSFAGVADRSP
jgi:hypothetical protein